MKILQALKRLFARFKAYMDLRIPSGLITLRVTPKIMDELERLRVESGEKDIAGVIIRSLALYDTVLEHRGEGGKLAFIHPDGTQEELE